jgi:uncharacterized LabA/DUF88 family protein
MDLSQPVVVQAKPRVALMIDGDNLSPEDAGQVILKAAQFGDLTIRRVYGNAQAPAGWTSAPGIRFVHSGSGKNATDLLMTVEAMAVILTAQADLLVLATSDRDFVHLATHLREKSVTVVGIGASTAPEAFRKACTKFLELKPKPTVVAAASVKQSSTPAPSASRELPKIDDHIKDLIKSEGEDGAMLIARLGGRMHSLHKIKISDQAQKTWRSYLTARPGLYVCDPKGAHALVRLKPQSG